MGNKNNRDDITYLIMDYLNGKVEDLHFSKEDNLKVTLNKLEKRVSVSDNTQLQVKKLKTILKS